MFVSAASTIDLTDGHCESVEHTALLITTVGHLTSLSKA